MEGLQHWEMTLENMSVPQQLYVNNSSFSFEFSPNIYIYIVGKYSQRPHYAWRESPASYLNTSQAGRAVSGTVKRRPCPLSGLWHRSSPLAWLI